MTALVPVLVALLSQTEPAPAAEAPAQPPPPAAPATPAPAGQPAAAPGGPRGGMGANKGVKLEEVTRQLERLKNMGPEETAAEARKIADQFGEMTGHKPPVEPPSSSLIDAEKFAALPEVEQVRVMARAYVSHLVSGDARSLVLLSGFPFQLEDRSLASPEELHSEWLKSLRNKRTDALTLYGVDVLTPAEMEKKYGKPPPRLARLPLREPKTFVTVNNLSGHAAIVVWRFINHGWQAVAYTD